MIHSVFSGTLYFDDESSDRITVNRLIVRDEEISFHLSSTWNGTATIIELDGTAVKSGGRFTSKSLVPKPIDAGFHSVIIEINEIDSFEEGITVAGVWKTQVSEIPFSGDLEFFNNPRRSV